MPFSTCGCRNPCMNFGVRFELFFGGKLTWLWGGFLAPGEGNSGGRLGCIQGYLVG